MTKSPCKSRTLALPLSCLLSIAAATPALAQTYNQVQTFPFNISNSASSGPLTVVNSGDFTATAQPFNPASGELISFEIAWDVDFTGSGIATVDNANLSGSAGGSYALGGIGYGGTGNGNGDNGLQNEAVSFNFNVAETHTFVVNNLTVGVETDMLAVILGGASFPLLWDADYVLTGGDVSLLSGTAIGSVRLTYTYLPEASTNAAMGLAFVAVGGVVWRRRQSTAKS